METTDKEIAALFEKKRKLLGLKGNYTLKQLEDAFHQRLSGIYIADVVFGANDGIITTFAVVAGATGAELATVVVIILGFANLVADGLSMGLGNYLGKRSELDYNRGQREKEKWEIENLRGIEVKEVRGIFARYGFVGADLDRAVEIVTNDKKAWVDLMMIEELGIVEDGGGTPAKHAVVTFISFAAAGLAPLIPYIIGITGKLAFMLSIAFSIVMLFTTGALRAKISPRAWWRAGFEMLIIGTVAAVAAYIVGKLLESIVR